MAVKFVAEVSSNHNKDLIRCKEFIDCASEIGCHSVKFQVFKIKELFSKEILKKSKNHRDRIDWELPLEFIPELYDYAHSKNIEFGCTPFYLDAVSKINNYVDFYKVASYEILWHDLFYEISKTKKPLVFSIGMATIDEIDELVNNLMLHNFTDITLLHCNSSYPTSLSEMNLAALDTLKKTYEKFNLKFGLSDHSVNDGAIYRAVHKYDAEMIEFHLDLDGKGAEFGAGHCWLPNKIGNVIKNINDGFCSDGSAEITYSESEKEERNWRADPSDGLRPLRTIRNLI